MPIKLKKGFSFFYKNELWKVTDIYKIKWNDGSVSNEYKIKNKKGLIRYLEIELSKNKANYSFWEKITDKSVLSSSLNNVDDDYIAFEKAKFPKQIKYKGVNYSFKERNDGICQYAYEKETINSIDYSNQDGSKLLSIEIWDDEVEISTGIIIEESQISRIEKGSPNFDSSAIIDSLGKYIGAIIIVGFILISSLLSRCSNGNSWSDNSSNYNDSTKVNRSNNFYRGRSSGGFGK
ncbi:DUF4178 domain-containing protein [Tamlana sp. I1]|uniref:DUF4178 domain-containing protein n=1 Tax=Tamlana sp. I1 TaxID=2762061 RepID=UPI00188E71B0|nr:DUF4178 domain-containing protein [Tamlana sp. I1]